MGRIYLRTDLDSDPRVVAVALAVERDVLDVVGRLWCLWSYAEKHSRNGVLRYDSRESIDIRVNMSGFAAALEKVDWLVVTDAGVKIPRYQKHCGQSAKVRKQDRERNRLYRERQRGPAVELIRARDGARCGICGKAVSPARAHLDHIIPVGNSLFAQHPAPNGHENLQFSHGKCNSRKGKSFFRHESMPVIPVLSALFGRSVTPQENTVSHGQLQSSLATALAPALSLKRSALRAVSGSNSISPERLHTLVLDIDEQLHETPSRLPLYHKIAKRMREIDVRRALSEVKAMGAEASNPGSVFVSICKRIAGEQGVHLGFGERRPPRKAGSTLKLPPKEGTGDGTV